MTVYWIARAKVTSQEGQGRYAEIVNRISGTYPHQTLVRAGKLQVLEGTRHFDRYYLHKFPSMEAALAFYNSPEYQEAAAIRRAACDGCELVLVEGLPGTG
jgi:uncharacterized protein (DUF1330 family)